MLYEYLVMHLPDNRTEKEEALDEHGENNWELVAVADGYAYMKREKE